MTTDAVLVESRRAIARGSKSFFTASLLLPGKIRDSAHLLYSWCRYCDDCVDGQHLGFADGSERRPAPEVLDYLIEQTKRALAGDSVEAAPFSALARVVAQCQLPKAYPLTHLEGFAMDVRGETFETLDETIRYSYHVAGVVGVMMAWIMGVRDRDVLDRGADLGIAFQLTNIARDVVDDAAAGRVYLPQQWLRELEIEPEDIAHPQGRSRLATVVTKLLNEAERYYESARVGIAHLPSRSAWSIATARLVYRDIGTRVRSLGSHAWDARVSLSLLRRLAWMTVAAGEIAKRSVTKQRELDRRMDLWPIPREEG